MNSVCSIPLITDPVLPQRDLLLDPEAVAALFRRQLGVNGHIAVESAEHLRTTYHAGESLRVAYRVFTGGSSCVVAGRAFPADASSKAFERVKPQVADCGPFRPVFHDSATETIFWTFPNDRKVPFLRLLTEIPQELALLLGSKWAKSNLVAYAPEKCATAQCLNEKDGILAYAKVYADDQSGVCFQTYSELRKEISADNAEINFPDVIFHSDAHHVLVLQALPGKRIAELHGYELRNAFALLGRALALLHNLPAPRHLPEFERCKNDHIQLAASTIGFIRPELAVLASELSGKLCDRLKGLEQEMVCLHGDVHPKNGVLLEKGIALIDLDQAALGSRAADLGSLLAALRYEQHIGLLSKEAEHELANAFLKGYRSIARLPEPESLRCHMAAALFAERAFRAVSRIRLPGLHCLPELLMDTQRILTGSDR